jgi:hypothetical protein
MTREEDGKRENPCGLLVVIRNAKIFLIIDIRPHVCKIIHIDNKTEELMNIFSKLKKRWGKPSHEENLYIISHPLKALHIS